MHAAIEDLGLDRLYVDYPGGARFPLHERVEALGLQVALEVGVLDT